MKTDATHTMMRIGVLIPTYNRKGYLAQALGSVLDQTYRDLEILVIDNGSTDGTFEFMASISDSRVKYVINENNLGMIGSINKGINTFSDDIKWCTILGDDDFLDKNCVMSLLHAMKDHAAKSIVHSHRIFVDHAGNKIRDATLSPPEETALYYMNMRAQLKRETYLTGVLFNRKTFQDIKGYPAFITGWATDDAFIFSLSLKDRLVFAKDAIAFVRIHEGAESQHASDGIKKLQSIKQFGAYCERMVRENCVCDSKQFNEFESVLHSYLRASYNYIWFNTFNYMQNKGAIPHHQFTDLITFLRDNRDKFSLRLRLADVCYRLTGIFPEVYSGYRTCWVQHTKLLDFLQHHLIKLRRKSQPNERSDQNGS